MPLPKYYEAIAHPTYKDAPLEERRNLNARYWKAYATENPDDEWGKQQMADSWASLDAQRDLESAAPVMKRALELQRDAANTRLVGRNRDSAGAWQSQEERDSYFKSGEEALAPKREAIKKTMSLFTEDVDKAMQPTWDTLQKTALEGGVFGERSLRASNMSGVMGNALAGQEAQGAVTARNQYQKVRDTMSKDFNLPPEEVDDLVKHRMGLQEKTVSRDAAGGLHLKPELLSKGSDEVLKEIDSSDLPANTKSKLKDLAPLHMSAYKAGIIQQVKEQHPELAKRLQPNWNGNVDHDYNLIDYQLNQSMTAQAGEGVTGGLLRGVGGAAYTAGLFVDKPLNALSRGGAALDRAVFGDDEPRHTKEHVVTDAAEDVINTGKAIQSTQQLSKQIYGQSLQFLGMDVGDIGSVGYSVIESTVIGMATVGFGPAVVTADRIARAGPTGKTLLNAAQRMASVTPIGGIYGLQRGVDVLERGGSATDALIAGGAEMGVMVAFSGVKLGGQEDLGVLLASPQARKQLGKSVTKAWTELGLKGTLGAVGETLEEDTNEVIQNLYVESKLNPGMTVNDLKKSLVETAKLSALAGGAAGTIGGAAEQGTNLVKPTYDQDLDSLHDEADARYKAATQENLPEGEAKGGTVAPPSPESVAPPREKITRKELEEAVAEQSPEDVGRPLEELAEERELELVEEDKDVPTDSLPVDAPPVDEAGGVATVYHAGPVALTSNNIEFDRGALGFHTGTKDQADYVASGKTGKGKGNVSQFQLLTTSPDGSLTTEEIDTDMSWEQPDALLSELVHQGLISEEDAVSLVGTWEASDDHKNAAMTAIQKGAKMFGNPDFAVVDEDLGEYMTSASTYRDKKKLRQVRELLKESGIGAIRYRNDVEGDGGKSTVILDASMVSKKENNEKKIDSPKSETDVAPVSETTKETIPQNTPASPLQVPPVPTGTTAPPNTVAPSSDQEAATPTEAEAEGAVAAPQKVTAAQIKAAAPQYSDQQAEVVAVLANNALFGAPGTAVVAPAGAPVGTGLKQDSPQGPRAEIVFNTEAAKAIIRIHESGNIDSFLHELIHFLEHFVLDPNNPLAVAEAQRRGITPEMTDKLIELMGGKKGADGKMQWDKTAKERFARNGELYFVDGKLPDNLSDAEKAVFKDVFDKIREWMGKIFEALMGSNIEVTIQPEVREILDKLLFPPQAKAAGFKPNWTSPDKPAKKPTRKLPPKVIGPRKAIMDEIAKEYDLGAVGAKPQGFTEEQLAKDALADIAKAKEFDALPADKQREAKEPPRVGPELVSYLLGNLDLVADPKETTLLTYEAAKTVKEIESLRARMHKEESSVVEEDIEAKREYLRQVIALLRFRGSQTGSALRAYRNIYNEQFEPEIMLSDYYGWQNSGKPKSEWVPVSKEKEAEIRKESAEIKKELADLEAAEERERVVIAEKEALLVENAALKDANEKLKTAKRPAVRKAPATRDVRDRLAGFGFKRGEVLEQSGEAIPENTPYEVYNSKTGEVVWSGKYSQRDVARRVRDNRDTKYGANIFKTRLVGPQILFQSAPLDPEHLSAFADLVASLRAEGKTAAQIQRELDAYGVTEHTEAILSAADSKKTGRRSPEQLAKEIDPDKELSPRMIYNMAYGLLKDGLKGKKMHQAMLKLVQQSRPETTLLEVLEAYTQYGKSKFPNPEKIAALNRKERRLALLGLQIDDIRNNQLPKLTGRQRDAADADIIKKTKKRNSLAREMGLTESADKLRMKGFLERERSRYKNDIAELQLAIDEGEAVAKKAKRTTEKDTILEELKAQKKAKQAEYNEVFGIDARKLTEEQRLAALDRILDREIKREEEMAAQGILDRPKTVSLKKTPAMALKAKRLAELRKARSDEKRHLAKEAKELLNPPKSDAEKWNITQQKKLERSIKRLEYYLANGKYPDKTPGVSYTQAEVVLELVKLNNDLKDTVAELQRQKRLKPLNVIAAHRRNAVLRSLTKVQQILQKQLDSGIYIAAKEKTQSADPTIATIRTTNKALREAVLQLKKTDPSWVASYEQKLDEALTKAAEKHAEKYEDMLAKGIFVDTEEVDRTPSKELDNARFKAHEAQRKWLEKRQQFNYDRAPTSEKVTKFTQALWEIMGAFNLGFDIAAGRQGLLPMLSNPKLAKTWFTVLKNSTEEGEHTQYERLSDPKRSPVAFYMQKFKNKQYKLYSPHDHLKFGKEDIPRPELLAALHKFIKHNRWLKLIPGAATALSTPTGVLIRLERANRMAHNILSDAMAAQQLGKSRLSGSKEVTERDTILAANAAMVGVRRGSFRNEQMEKGFPLINLFFISGRYLTSGLQYVTGQPVWTARGGYRGTLKMRARIAWNLYGRVLLSAQTLAYALGWALYGDDEEKWKRFINPLDNRYMILTHNGVDYNFFKAITPYVSIISKLVMGYKVTDGKIVTLRGEGAQWGRTLEDEWGVFLKNRRSLRLALAADILKGEHYDGSDVTAWSVFKKMVTPINFANDLKILESEQVPAVQKALSLTAIHLSLDAQMQRAAEAKAARSTKLKLDLDLELPDIEKKMDFKLKL